MKRLILALLLIAGSAAAQPGWGTWTCQAISPGTGLIALRSNVNGQQQSVQIDNGTTRNGWGAWACLNDWLGSPTLAARTNADGRQQSIQIDGATLPY